MRENSTSHRSPRVVEIYFLYYKIWIPTARSTRWDWQTGCRPRTTISVLAGQRTDKLSSERAGRGLVDWKLRDGECKASEPRGIRAPLPHDSEVEREQSRAVWNLQTKRSKWWPSGWFMTSNTKFPPKWYCLFFCYACWLATKLYLSSVCLHGSYKLGIIWYIY